MEKSQLLFVPVPGIGHLMSTVELAKLLLGRDDRLSATVLIMKPYHFDSTVVDNYTLSVLSSSSLSNRIQFVHLPKDQSEKFNIGSFVQRQIPHVKEAVSKIIQSGSESPRLVGLVLDMFCSSMIDVANDFGVPSYIFFTSSAAFLGFMLRMQANYDEKKFDPTELMESGTELAMPCLVNPFPAKVMPSALLSKEWRLPLLDNFRRFKEAKGIIINTFFELESHAIESFSNDGIENISVVYPVGPILNEGDDHGSIKQQEIMQWLDDQPESSVVFLCFGSRGSFSEDQVKEIAYALERSGHRFLWSLRRPPPAGKTEYPKEYENPEEVLPKDFLDRTAQIGKIIGWAPQTAVLAHKAVGGFISHSGWNSILESIWYGVPIGSWPLYAEQQFNSFEIVTELGLATEIKMDYRKDSEIILSSDKIEKGIIALMKQDSEKRLKMKKMSEMSRITFMKGGSSDIWLSHLIEDVFNNVA